MSSRTWRDWSCTVRLVIGQDETPPDRVLDGGAAIVRALMADVEQAVSRFRPDSELEAVNDAAPRIVPVGPITLALVSTALDAARRTGGAVDPTIGPHVAAWGYDADIASVGHEAGVARPVPSSAGRSADWRRVVVDRALSRVGVARGLRLDLGATAKAWTADRAARRVAARYRLPVLVEIGGDVAVSGAALAPWRVRVAEVVNGPGSVVGLTHGGVATSSTTARRWSTATGEAHHVIDPRTGAPTDGEVRSATIWAPSCVAANTFSTAALVWSRSARARLELAGVTARLVDRDGTIRTVGGWPSEERAA